MTFRICRLCLIFSFASLFGKDIEAQISPKTWGDWQNWGDFDSELYMNPILPADYSDIDCIKQGDDYYAISSTLQFSPGIIILHSKDLVNWSIIGHAVGDLTEISSEMNWTRMNRYGRGIWAGAIRYHKNKFYIYFGTPDEGYFVTCAKDPSGPWRTLHKILPSKGWDDCCPFWDDDGQGYLVGTQFSNSYKIHVFKLSSDDLHIIRNSDHIIHASNGSEANKLYKINGLYYHLFSEVKPEGRCVMMERSKNIIGPYQNVKQLNHAQKEFHSPNQGALIQAPNGNWYFLTHHGEGDWSGRILSLLPVTWKNGWPLIGEVGSDDIGHMVWTNKKPVTPARKILPQTSDNFEGANLSPQWEWNYQPRSEKWSLSARPGWLRLYAFKPLQTNNLLKAGNTLTQRSFRTSKNVVTVKLDISHMANGQQAGLCHFAVPHTAQFGINCQTNMKTLEFRSSDTTFETSLPTADTLWLRSIWGLDGVSRFYYSLNGTDFKTIGPSYQLTWGAYRGDRIGIYCYNNETDDGFVDVDYFQYDLEDSKK